MSFYDPQGVHLRTYSDNHLRPVDSSGNPYVNFAFDTLSQELLQDGTFHVDDDIHRYRNGFVFGEGDPSMRTSPTTGGVQSGLAFWSRPADNKTPHLHVDDWNDATGAGEFGYPIGYSSHEDASFAYATTADKIDGGKVGAAYYETDAGGTVIRNILASDVAAKGQAVRVVRVVARASPPSPGETTKTKTTTTTTTSEPSRGAGSTWRIWGVDAICVFPSPSRSRSSASWADATSSSHPSRPVPRAASLREAAAVVLAAQERAEATLRQASLTL